MLIKSKSTTTRAPQCATARALYCVLLAGQKPQWTKIRGPMAQNNEVVRHRPKKRRGRAPFTKRPKRNPGRPPSPKRPNAGTQARSASTSASSAPKLQGHM